MIPAAMASGSTVSRPTITSVTQFQTSSIVNASFGPSSNPISSSGLIEIQTSPDGTTWTPQGIVAGASGVGLSGGSTSSTIGFIAASLRYRIRQSMFGLVGEWSDPFIFSSGLVTPPVTPPLSVTITNVVHTDVSGYTVSFTVNQSAAAPSGTAVNVMARIRSSAGTSSYVSVGGAWSSGNSNYSTNLAVPFSVGATFEVDVYNTAGGYDSTVAVSASFPPPLVPTTQVLEYFAGSANVTIPVWAINFDYWVAGAGGGGGSGEIESVGNNAATSLYTVGDPGNPGQVLSGTVNLPVDNLNVIVGTGGIGAQRVFNTNATAGQSSRIRSDTTDLVNAAGGAGGANATTPVTVFTNPSRGTAAANVTVDTSTFNGAPGAFPYLDASWPNFDIADADSVQVAGGAGGGSAFPNSGLANGVVAEIAGGNGGTGYIKIQFKNYV